MLLLVVDDDASMLRLLSRLLRSEGHEVDTCGSGEEAMVLLRGRTYAVLLTDLVMPGMGGLELVRQARALSVGLRCVVISGQQRPEEAELAGAGWVRKPVDFDLLLASLDAA